MKRGIAMALVALGAVIVQPLHLEAAGPDPNLKAIRYNRWLLSSIKTRTCAARRNKPLKGPTIPCAKPIG